MLTKVNQRKLIVSGVAMRLGIPRFRGWSLRLGLGLSLAADAGLNRIFHLIDPFSNLNICHWVGLNHRITRRE